MATSNASGEYSDAPAQGMAGAKRLLGQALDILDRHEAPAEIRARLNDVIDAIHQVQTGGIYDQLTAESDASSSDQPEATPSQDMRLDDQL